MKDYSWFETVEKKIGLRCQYKLEWRGEQSIARLSAYAVRICYGLKGEYKQGDSLAFDTYRLKVLDYEFYSDSYLVCRDTDAKAQLLFAFDWIRERLKNTKQRIIMTFFVWGVADRELGRYGDWKDIKIVRYLFGE
jgi:hypothetical protein